MSHVTDGKLRIRDLDALEEAAPHCGLELRRGQKTHAWWGNFVGDSTPPQGRSPKDYGKCEHALGRIGKAPANGPSGEWEIGLVPALDGDGFDLMLDTFGGAGRNLMEGCGGPSLNKLRQEYAFATARRQAEKTLQRKGWVARREALPNNRLRLKLTKR